MKLLFLYFNTSNLPTNSIQQGLQESEKAKKSDSSIKQDKQFFLDRATDLLTDEIEVPGWLHLLSSLQQKPQSEKNKMSTNFSKMILLQWSQDE